MFLIKMMPSLLILLRRLRATGARRTDGDGDKRRLALTQRVQQRRTVRGQVRTQVLPGVGLQVCEGRVG